MCQDFDITFLSTSFAGGFTCHQYFIQYSPPHTSRHSSSFQHYIFLLELGAAVKNHNHGRNENLVRSLQQRLGVEASMVSLHMID